MAVIGNFRTSGVTLMVISLAVIPPELAAAQAPAAGAQAASDAKQAAALGIVTRAKSARPNGRPGDWFSDNDYPVASLRALVSGTVAFRLTVAADGSVSACEIVGKGVNDELNQTTCDLLMRRAHFFPATDADGKPVMGTYNSSVRWQIPNQLKPMPTPKSMDITYDITADGTIANCQVRTSGLTADQMANANEKVICASVGHFAPLPAVTGHTPVKHVVMTTAVTVTDGQ